MRGGPFNAYQIRPGDPYELSRGEPIRCAPTGGAGAGANQLGASVVGWDPAVKEVGVDAGYAPVPNMLRAPDVAVGNVPNKPGWIQGAPSLAIEYADRGQEEGPLEEKIADLLEAGTQFVWVVRLVGPRRVEVHEPNKPMRTAFPGALLTAPGVLQNPVEVEALYDRDAAERATLTNLLQRHGYKDLESVLQEGRQEGQQKGQQEGALAHARRTLRRTLERRRIAIPSDLEARIDACRDVAELDAWQDRALDASRLEDVFFDP